MKQPIAPVQCPHCRRSNELAIGVGTHGRPSAGDMALCVSCGEWMVFERNGARHPTDDEYLRIGRDVNARRAREAWVMATQGRRPQ